jgi:hypothetical protein
MNYALLWGRAHVIYHDSGIFPPPFIAKRHGAWRDVKGARVARNFVKQVKTVLGVCSKCGYDSEHVGTYDFDHIDTRTKIENVSTMAREGRPIGEIHDEILKTQFLCANCHRERTAVQFNWK